MDARIDTEPMSAYERRQYERILRWQEQPPDLATRITARATGPAGRVVQALIPATALRVALDTAQAAAQRLGARRSILRRGHTRELGDLADGPLERSDRLARHVQRRAMLLAGGSGALFGSVGAPGLVADVPSLLVIAFRSIYRTGLCYGEDCMTGTQQSLPVAIFALACANDAEDKRSALAVISDEKPPAGKAVRNSMERAAQHELAKGAASLSFQRLARQVGLHLGWRKAAESLPLAGALVGGSVNAWYLRDVSRAAQRVFQLRWLQAHYGIALPPVDGA